MPLQPPEISRRHLLSMIGKTAGGGLMYQAMASLGHAQESSYRGPLELGRAKRGGKVVILGAGLAGMTAAYELRAAGYDVQILEYQGRAGGRSWSLRGGDSFTELDGTRQTCEFDKGLYINPGPWRVPYHHYALLDYCKRFGVQLEPFMQVNFNALVHSTRAFGGKPQRFRHVQSDTRGYVAELLAKAANSHALDQAVTQDDLALLMEDLKAWGGLDAQYRYREGHAASEYRGYDSDPAGGLMPLAKPSKPIALQDLLRSRLWSQINIGQLYEFQTAIFEPVGGMDMIAKGFERQVGSLVHYHRKVTRIEQSPQGVTVSWVDANQGGDGGAVQQVKADWCVCTIPLSILSQIDIQVGDPMKAAIAAVPYGASFKVGLQFKRRFWEEDERIFGGISYTDLPIEQISYPSNNYNTTGPAVLLGGYAFDNTHAFEFTAMKPEDRVRAAVEFGAQLHPQYRQEFQNGVSVGWHRIPWINGCFGIWSDESRKQHYKNLCAVDGRIVLAGEHASYIPAWQEGAVLSALDAVKRLHEHAQAAA
ncbi:monoamine oxidase [Oryzisolibacter propanilivorax]|uniref:Tryptophan 2-monooxygenase n=1 Tax=Oryzisolibacter propanilivorax TaxID=1527607 RepID=A0A1G9U8M9_9BURK|nr:flavin monoamine oxidase family protein [Oryzisolibacter propanilivorax]SDM56300.1 monoamine oxidase [Oryzisolibacter propanilivorax]